jgi:hypothetical protein
VQDHHAVGLVDVHLRGQLVGDITGAVRRIVVDHDQTEVGQRQVEQPFRDLRKIDRLVVRRDDNGEIGGCPRLGQPNRRLDLHCHLSRARGIQGRNGISGSDRKD